MGFYVAYSFNHMIHCRLLVIFLYITYSIDRLFKRNYIRYTLVQNELPDIFT